MRRLAPLLVVPSLGLAAPPDEVDDATTDRDVPTEATAPMEAADPAAASSDAPPAEAATPPAEDPAAYELVVSADPLGQGDDRVATQYERSLQATPGLGPCWSDRVVAGATPLRVFSFEVKLRLNGQAKKVEPRFSTGDEAIDACVVALVEAHVLSPPPMFPDRLEVAVTWRKPGAYDE